MCKCAIGTEKTQVYINMKCTATCTYTYTVHVHNYTNSTCTLCTATYLTTCTLYTIILYKNSVQFIVVTYSLVILQALSFRTDIASCIKSGVSLD